MTRPGFRDTQILGPDGTPVSSTNRLPVSAELSGRNAEQVLITNTPLGAGDGTQGGAAEFTSEWFDATEFQPFQEGLTVRASDVVEVVLEVSDAQTDGEDYYRIAVPRTGGTSGSNNLVIPPLAIPARYWRYRIRNYAATALTELAVYANRFHHSGVMAGTVAPVLIDGFEIRDASTHAPTLSADVGMYYPNLMAFGNSPKSILVRNDHDQAVNITVRVSSRTGIGGNIYATLGTFEVAAGGQALVTNQDYAGLDVPMHDLYLLAKCSVAPTTGFLAARLTVDANY